MAHSPMKCDSVITKERRIMCVIRPASAFPSIFFSLAPVFFLYFIFSSSLIFLWVNSLLRFNSIFSTLFLCFLLLELSGFFFSLFSSLFFSFSFASFIEEFDGRGDSSRFRVLWLDLSCIESALRFVDIELLMLLLSVSWGSLPLRV